MKLTSRGELGLKAVLELAKVEGYLRQLLTSERATYRGMVAHYAQYEIMASRTLLGVWPGTQRTPLICTQTGGFLLDETHIRVRQS